MWGVAFLGLGDFGGGATGEDFTASATTLRSHVNNPVCLTDDVEVVFDDDNGITSVDKAPEHLHEDADILEMEAGGGLVEDVDGLTCVALGQFGGELDALALAAGEGGGGLPDFDVA